MRCICSPLEVKFMKLAAVFITLLVLMFCPALLHAAATTTEPAAAQVSVNMEGSKIKPAADVIPAPSIDQAAMRMNVIESQAKIDELVIALSDKEQAEKKEAPANDQAEPFNGNEEGQAEAPRIPDPLEPVNKVVYHFNDKLYFWGVKPVTQVYSHIVPEDFRFAISNVYDNLWAPSRVINNLLQLRLKSAGNELIRFLFNSFAGVGGMGDMADKALGIKKQEADFGQTLGHYGIGHGIYLVLPVFGPSSIRDGIGIAGDRFMHPLTYVPSRNLTFGEKVGISTHEKVNETSFRIGDYESFKAAALDPYVSMRDAFVQNRLKAVEDSKR
jgi:phospholipid-binding lipoprotein MlaA